MHLRQEKVKIAPMLNYAICEISGKQYKVIPGKVFAVSLQKESDQIGAKVLLLSEDGTISIGQPYLKKDLILKRVEDIKGRKIRVAKFHAKANYRRVKGYRSKLTKVALKTVKTH